MADIWVDAGSDQLLREIGVKRVSGGVMRIQADHEWLERTPEALTEAKAGPAPSSGR